MYYWPIRVHSSRSAVCVQGRRERSSGVLRPSSSVSRLEGRSCFSISRRVTELPCNGCHRRTVGSGGGGGGGRPGNVGSQVRFSYSPAPPAWPSKCPRVAESRVPVMHSAALMSLCRQTLVTPATHCSGSC